MKILHVVGAFNNGGIELLLVNVANAQVAAGSKVAIMIITDSYSSQLLQSLDPRVIIHIIGKPLKSKNPLYLLKIVVCLFNFVPDILHLHAPNLAPLFFVKPISVHTVVTIHNETLQVRKSKHVDCYVAISDTVRNSFIKQTGSTDIITVYNGIDVARYKRKERYETIPYRILSLGRVCFDVKGQDMLIRSLRNLPQEVLCTLHVEVWGDGPDFARLQKLIKEYELDGVVFLRGNVSNQYVAEHLCEYDLMILCSHHEGLGIAAIESAVVGLPLLTSSASGFQEVSDNGKYALHYRHDDCLELTTALLFSIRNYQALVNNALNAQSYAHRLFSLNTHVDALNELYKKSKVTKKLI